MPNDKTLRPFKEEGVRFEAPLGREALTLQHYLAMLDIEWETLQETYLLSDNQLKNLLFGTPAEVDKQQFFTIYYEIKAQVDAKKRESNQKAQIKRALQYANRNNPPWD